MTAWLEVSLTVDGELAEPVAEVLSRFAPDGVVLHQETILPEDDGEGIPVGPVRVCAYLPADEALEDTRQKLEEALWFLGRIRPLPAAQYQPIADTDWMAAWKKRYRPVEIGRRLIIVPAWLEVPPGGRLPIRIDPGMAFGTGAHPTTQLCLELLEGCLDGQSPAPAVIDVGCGSGILSTAALLLGASHALGVDIDAEAVRAARQNAELNGVSQGLEAGLGSVDEVRAGQFSRRQAGLVMANILAPVILRLLAGGLGELVEPGGALLLSGILAEQAGSIRAALPQYGLRLVDERQSGDWVALLARRED